MPKFDRTVLAGLFPRNPKAMSDFEKLNTDVDVSLPGATAAAQATADEARLLAAIARANPDVLRPLVEQLQSNLLIQRGDRAQIDALTRRVNELEARLLALQRGADDQLRRRIDDLQSLQATR